MNEYEIRLECLKMAERVAGTEVAAMLKAAQVFTGFALGHGAPYSTSSVAAKTAQYLRNEAVSSIASGDPA